VVYYDVVESNSGEQNWTEAEREDLSDRIRKSFHELLDLTPVGVNFYFGSVKTSYERPDEPVSFCQAVDRVMKSSRNLLLKEEDLSCPASKMVLGFENHRETLLECARKLVDARRFPSEGSAVQVLSDVPQIRGETSAVLLSVLGVVPDVYILYLPPIGFMRILQAYQRVYVRPLILSVTGVMPVCGGSAVRPYVTNEVSLSFGCDDSRNIGGISESEMVLGVPFGKAASILKDLAEMKFHDDDLTRFLV
jgi:uncharacterized protein (DUF169 family)